MTTLTIDLCAMCYEIPAFLVGALLIIALLPIIVHYWTKR